ncbi:hypothetical protein [Dinoroseobacter sp. S124A]|uniref:hypothetical protein n=1 Tax=Dinoroseobacter sp. S124A TaxID=3415128 RepID=UPI003C7C3792
MTDQTPLTKAVTDPEHGAIAAGDLNAVLAEMRATLREVAVSARLSAMGPERVGSVFFRDRVIKAHLPYADFDEGQKRLAMTARHEDELSFFQLAEHDIVPPGRSLVVVGGYVGVSTVALAQIASPGPIHVFEPQTCLQEPLEKTLALNGLSAQIHRSVVTEDGARMALGTQKSARLGETIFVARAKGDYPATTLDAEDLGAVGLLHLCFNGSKIPALRGALETIQRDSPVILCDKTGRDLKEIADLLGGLGYEHQAVGPKLYLYVRAAG